VDRFPALTDTHYHDGISCKTTWEKPRDDPKAVKMDVFSS
jgi:hypothetical protein